MSESDDNKSLEETLADVLPDAIVPPTTQGKGKVDLTDGPIQGHVFRMLGPFAIAVISLLSAGIIDTIYLGNLTGANGDTSLGVIALAAVGFAYPLTFLGNSANIGLGAGTMSDVSRAIGRGDMEQAARHGAAAILFAVAVMSVLVTVMWLSVPFALPLMGAEGDVLIKAKQYLAISLPGLVIVSVAMISNNILRAGGEALLPSSIMILGAVLNIIIDPFLIFGWGPFPRMEVAGAALATVIGNTIAAMFGFYIVQFRRKAIDFIAMTVRSMLNAWKAIGKVGIPAALTNIIVPVGTTISVGIIGNTLTTEDVAAFTLTSRAELISVGLLYALSACIGAITGQNGGAGKTERVRDAFKTCYKICLVWSTLMAVILAIFARPIADVFTNDPVVLEKAVAYFWIVPITIAGYGFVFVSAAGFNALGRPLFGLVFTVIRSLVLYAPLIGLGVYFDGLRGAFFGIAAANVISGAIAYYVSMKKAPMTAKVS
ncbi:MATE family efflux transporter [Litorimonas sp. RW-G-Af-16]|uniref:MATE family efflux transporter n=1 Tax=Litorimonas sp. RW-G-Af-16 TaxID=3241168 RepID=UPI00390CB4CC